MNHYEIYLKQKKEKRNRLFLFIAIVLFFIVATVLASCKKKPTPIPDPPYVCQTGTVLFAGNYYLLENSNYKISIQFLNNNCPKENSNTYVIKGLSEALQLYAKPNTTIAVQDYTISSEEGNLFANTLVPFPITLRIKQQNITVIGVSTSKTTNELSLVQLK